MLPDPGPTQAPLHSAAPQQLSGTHIQLMEWHRPSWLASKAAGAFLSLFPQTEHSSLARNTAQHPSSRGELSNSSQLVPKQDNSGSLSYCCESSTTCHSNALQLPQGLCQSQSTAAKACSNTTSAWWKPSPATVWSTVKNTIWSHTVWSQAWATWQKKPSPKAPRKPPCYFIKKGSALVFWDKKTVHGPTLLVGIMPQHSKVTGWIGSTRAQNRKTAFKNFWKWICFQTNFLCFLFIKYQLFRRKINPSQGKSSCSAENSPINILNFYTSLGQSRSLKLQGKITKMNYTNSASCSHCLQFSARPGPGKQTQFVHSKTT